MRPLLLTLLSAATLSAASLSAQDVHVRVQPGAPASSPQNPGSEAQTVFPTIQNALDHHPFPPPAKDGKPGRTIIELAPGIYHERILVTRNHPNLTLLGTGAHPEDTVITNSLNARAAGGTFFTATAEIDGDAFQADNLTFENSAGDQDANAGQAVAAAVRSDRAIFKRVRFLGHQDTLFADFGRQYYLDCFLTGGVDYIFGNAAAVFDRSQLNSNGPGFITAHSRTSPTQSTGFVILNSRVTSSIPNSSTNTAIGLGRPWRPYARTIFISTSLPANLIPAGWNNWSKLANESTAWYAEYGSTGPGASPSTRVPWAHPLTGSETHLFLPAAFLAGSDHWNPVAEAARLP